MFFVALLKAQKKQAPIQKPPEKIAMDSISEHKIKEHIQILHGFFKKEAHKIFIDPLKIKDFFKNNGLRATYGKRFLQHFSFVKYKPTETQKLALTFFKDNKYYQKLNLQYKTDFDFTPPNISKSLYTQIVFVGYGMQYGMLAYDDFKGVEVRDKIILRIKGFPGHKDTLSLAYKAFRHTDVKDTHKLEDSKNFIAKKLGAWGIIDVDTEKNDALHWNTNISFDWEKNIFYDSSYLKNEPLQIKISKRLFKKMLHANNINIREFEKEVASNLSKFYSKTLENTNIEIHTSVLSKRVKCKNIVGMILGKNTSENIVVQANYRDLKKSSIMGLVGMFTIISVLKDLKIKPNKNIIFLSTIENKESLSVKYFSSTYKGKINKWIYCDHYFKKQNNNIEQLKNIIQKVFLDLWKIAYEIKNK